MLTTTGTLVITYYLQCGGGKKERMNTLIFQVHSLSSYTITVKTSQAWDLDHLLPTLSPNFNDLTCFSALI